MRSFLSVLTIIGAVGLASLSDSVAAIWAREENKFSIHLLLLLILGPAVFITFGLVTTKLGLAVTSGVINSLLVLSTIGIGLFFFDEWQKVSSPQYIGMLLSLIGIILMLCFPKQ